MREADPLGASPSVLRDARSSAPSNRLWIECTDLADFLRRSSRPTGVQRTILELGRALLERNGTGPMQTALLRLPFDPRATPAPGRIDTARFLAIAQERGAKSVAPNGDLRSRLVRNASRLRALVPGFAQKPLQRLYRHVVDGRAPDRLPIEGQAAVAPGDILFVPGIAWWDEAHPARIEALLDRHGLELAALVHDLTPITDPDWYPRGHGRLFAVWLDCVARRASVVFVNSQSTLSAWEAWSAGRAIRPGQRIRTILLGADAGALTQQGADSAPPPARPFALYVSSIETRKDQALLLDAWTVLLDRLGQDCPDLLLVGRLSTGGGAVLARIERDPRLAASVRVRHDVDDRELLDLYRAARFTLFPSRHEGFGLPIAESLALGRYCIAARAGAIPEVGQGLIGLHEPGDRDSLVSQVIELVREPARLAEAEARIRARYRPPLWADAATAIEEGLLEARPPHGHP